MVKYYVDSFVITEGPLELLRLDFLSVVILASVKIVMGLVGIGFRSLTMHYICVYAPKDRPLDMIMLVNQVIVEKAAKNRI